MIEPNNNSTNDTLGHEPETMDTRTVAMLVVGLLAIVIFALVIVGLGFRWFVPYSAKENAGQQWQNQRGNPGVEANQKYDRQELQANERKLLDGYGWQDEQRTVARIPIIRAMKLMVERELEVDWPKFKKEPQ